MESRLDLVDHDVIGIKIKEEPPEDFRCCLICLSHCSPPEINVNMEGLTELTSGFEPLVDLRKNLLCVFLLRNLLQAPADLCQYLLVHTKGENPSRWCSVCGECLESVKNAFRVHHKILRLQEEVRMMGEAMKGKMKASVEQDEEADWHKETQSVKHSHDIIRDYFINKIFPDGKAKSRKKKHEHGDQVMNTRLPRRAKNVTGSNDHTQIFSDNSSDDDWSDNLCIPEGIEMDVDIGEELKLSLDIERVGGDKSRCERAKKVTRRTRGVASRLHAKSKLADFEDSEDGNNEYEDNSDADASYSPSEDTAQVYTRRRKTPRRKEVDRTVHKPAKRVREKATTTILVESSSEQVEEKPSRELARKTKATRIKPFACTSCNRTFNTKKTLNAHRLMHSKRNKLSCKICNYPLESESNLKNHMKRYHFEKSKAIYKCSKCDYSSHVYGRTWYHKQTKHFIRGNQHEIGEVVKTVRKPYRHTGDSPTFACKLCKHAYVNPMNYQKHLRFHAQFKSTSCKVCNYPCSSEKLLAGHMERFHKDKAVEYHCEKCPYVTDVKHKFFRHRNSHATREEEEQKGTPTPTGKKYGRPEAKFHCSLCNHSFMNRINLKAHMRRHRKWKETSCAKCNYPLETAKALEVHMNKYHMDPKRKFECQKCAFKCETSYTFWRHKANHKITDNFDESDDSLSARGQVKCKLCGLVDKRRSMFKHVKEAHSQSVGEGVSLCHLCHKTFSTKSRLNEHIRTVHENKKKYYCEKCGKGFMLQVRCDSHKAKCIQGLKGSLTCESCGNIYACKDTLRVHRKKFHPEVWAGSAVG